MNDILFVIAIVGLAGMASQWLAWRLRLPAIALLLAFGLLLGPGLHLVRPADQFGALYRPFVSLAVALVLFEGGLTLNFREIRGLSTTVRRIVFVGGPIIWLMTTLAARYVGRLSWETATVLGALLVVTGPTVIMPLLKTARLQARPASLLRWEAIVTDPIGALFAVVSFEIVLVLHGEHEALGLALRVGAAALVAVAGGYLLARAIATAFVRGWTPEYLKAPILIVVVIAAFALSNLILEEAGLLTVTVAGVTLGNLKFASYAEIRRFKEMISILLVSGVFILLSASLDPKIVAGLDLRLFGVIGLVLFVIRPLVILALTIGGEATIKERILVGWIAPRGIVAVAVAGLFGGALVQAGVADGLKLTAAVYVVVAATIVLHGFGLVWLSGLLGLRSDASPGILIVGASPWSQALAVKLKEAKIPVLIADAHWGRLVAPRLADIPVWFGEVLAAEAHHAIDFNRFGYLFAVTDDDAYNTLVCNEFGPDLGRGNIFQIGRELRMREDQAMPVTIGGRFLFKPDIEYDTLQRSLATGWSISRSLLTKEFGLDDYVAARSKENRILFWVRPTGAIVMPYANQGAAPEAGDQIFAFGPMMEKGGRSDPSGPEHAALAGE